MDHSPRRMRARTQTLMEVIQAAMAELQNNEVDEKKNTYQFDICITVRASSLFKAYRKIAKILRPRKKRPLCHIDINNASMNGEDIPEMELTKASMKYWKLRLVLDDPENE